MFAFRREILMCRDKLETSKFEDEDEDEDEDENEDENESLKVFPRLLKILYPWKASLHYFHQKV